MYLFYPEPTINQLPWLVWVVTSLALTFTFSAWVFPKSENFHLLQTEGLTGNSPLFWLIDRRRIHFLWNELDQKYLPGISGSEVHGRATILDLTNGRTLPLVMI